MESRTALVTSGATSETGEVTVTAMPRVMACAFIDIGDTDAEMLMRSLATTSLEPPVDLYKRIIALLLNARVPSTAANIACTLKTLLKRGEKARHEVTGAALKTLGISFNHSDDQPTMDVLVDGLLEALKMGVDLRHPGLCHGDSLYKYYSTFQHGDGPDDDFDDENATDARAGLSSVWTDKARETHFAHSVTLFFDFFVDVLETHRGWMDVMLTISSGTAVQFVSTQFVKKALDSYSCLVSPPDGAPNLPDYLQRLAALGRFMEVCFIHTPPRDRPILRGTVTSYLKNLPHCPATARTSVRILDALLKTFPKSPEYKCEILTALLSAQYGGNAARTTARPWRLKDISHYFTQFAPDTKQKEQELIIILTNLVTAVLDLGYTHPNFVDVTLTEGDIMRFADGVEQQIKKYPRYRTILETTAMAIRSSR